MLTGFKVYRTYLALKSHFTTESYDFIKYKGKTRASLKTYENRRDKYLFEKLSTQYDKKSIIDFFIANFTHGNRTFGLYDIKEESFKVYLNWKGRIESLGYLFSNDVKYILKNCGSIENSFIIHPMNDYPPVIKYCFSKSISLETVLILDEIYEFMDKLYITEDVFYPNFKMLVSKYKRLVKINKERYIAIINKSKEDVTSKLWR